MNKAAPAILAFLAAATVSFAQEPRPDTETNSSIEASTQTTPSNPWGDGISVTAQDVRLSTADKVVGNLRFLFNPSRAFDYWPDYLYEYEKVKASGLCDWVGGSTSKYEIGMVAMLHSTGTDNEDSVAAATYSGRALRRTGSDASESIPVDLDDLCKWMLMDWRTSDGTVPADTDLYIATSRIIPAQDLEFVGRVNLVTDVTDTEPFYH